MFLAQAAVDWELSPFARLLWQYQVCDGFDCVPITLVISLSSIDETKISVNDWQGRQGLSKWREKQPLEKKKSGILFHLLSVDVLSCYLKSQTL